MPCVGSGEILLLLLFFCGVVLCFGVGSWGCGRHLGGSWADAGLSLDAAEEGLALKSWLGGFRSF